MLWKHNLAVGSFFFEERHQKPHQHLDEGSITVFITKQTIVLAFIYLNTNFGGFFYDLFFLQKFLKSFDIINPYWTSINFDEFHEIND